MVPVSTHGLILVPYVHGPSLDSQSSRHTGMWGSTPRVEAEGLRIAAWFRRTQWKLLDCSAIAFIGLGQLEQSDTGVSPDFRTQRKRQVQSHVADYSVRIFKIKTPTFRLGTSVALFPCRRLFGHRSMETIDGFSLRGRQY